MASLKVGFGLACQAALRGRGAVANTCINGPVHSVTSENNPSSAGVVRRMARSDHCRWVSTPRWRRPRFSSLRWDGARMVRNGSARRRFAPFGNSSGIGSTTISDSQPGAGLDEEAARGSNRIAVVAAV